jgi:hypothetical protein
MGPLDSRGSLVRVDDMGYSFVPLDEREHRLTVDAWFERVARGRSSDALIQAFERAFAALWKRSHLTLGEVTLTAIAERVLHTAMERYPILGSIEITASGLDCQRLRAQQGLPLSEVTDAIRFVLLEFLSVLGNLTAQILSPALRLELANDHAVEDRAP